MLTVLSCRNIFWCCWKSKRKQRTNSWRKPTALPNDKAWNHFASVCWPPSCSSNMSTGVLPQGLYTYHLLGLQSSWAGFLLAFFIIVRLICGPHLISLRRGSVTLTPLQLDSTFFLLITKWHLSKMTHTIFISLSIFFSICLLSLSYMQESSLPVKPAIFWIPKTVLVDSKYSAKVQIPGQSWNEWHFLV